MRVGILSASPGSIPGAEKMTTHDLVERVAGRNTGNLAFRYAVDRHIASPKVHVTWDADPRWAREQCDVLVIPSANQINPAADFSKRADFLESAGLPCLALGLGAQARMLGDEIKLTAGTLRYLRALAEHSTSIGIRGEYTGQVLGRLGIRNTTVIGCPSYFISPENRLGETIEGKLRGTAAGRIAVTAGDLDPGYVELERKLFEWLVSGAGTYICQSHVWLVSLARQRLDEVTADEVEVIRSYLSPDSATIPTVAAFVEFVRKRFRVFFDAAAWIEHLAGVDLVIGPRIHGNLLAAAAKTPGVCIYHDARTQELCETTLIPRLSRERLMSMKHPSEVALGSAFDGNAFDQRRAMLARECAHLLTSLGIEISPGLTALSEATHHFR